MKPGRLFTVVGPSGVGKDSLIRGVQNRRPDLHVVRRVITRPEEAGFEAFEGVTEAEFARRRAAGEFVLDWQAHGLSYGIPATVREVLAAGRDALFNGSRAVLAEAQAAFPGLVVIHVTATPAVLAQRLSARGREGAEDVAYRLSRAALPLPEGLRHVIEIDNSGDYLTAVAAMLDAVQPVSA